MEPLSAKEIERYQDLLLEHGSVYGASICTICDVARCPTWVDAFDTLAANNQLMIDPSKLPRRAPERAK